MLAETLLSKSDLVYPLFVKEEQGDPTPVKSMPGIFQYSVNNIGSIAKEIESLGIPAVILFGIPNKKDANGSEAYNSSGIIQKAIAEIREKTSKIQIIADCCLCEYTDHGHCGPVKNGSPDNDLTLELLQKTALSQVKAGAHIIAPSGMIDGMVGSIRTALDQENFYETPILSYSAKYASSFYGPFREAAGSGTCFKGDRKSHQLDPRNLSQAIEEVRQDIQEGADIIMIKPALPYLDIIKTIKDNFTAPIAAYQVSGEYSMIKAASQNGWLDEKDTVIESLTSIKRAGADLIITYFAKEFAQYEFHT